MEQVGLSDWVSLYAAVLATVLAISNLMSWLLSGPRLSVLVFGPAETAFGRSGSFLTIVSNSGRVSTVVQRLEVSFRTSRWWGKEIGKAIFDERSSWKPSVKLVAIENKPNSFREEPNLLAPNEEIRAPAKPVSGYRSDQHWICVTANARNSRRKFSGWARPSVVSSSKGQD
jgi:hypothetical protein